MADTNAVKQRGRNRAIQRIIKRIVWVLVAAGVVAGVVVTAMPKPVAVERQPVARGELLVTIDEDGKSRVKDRYIVSAPLMGNLGRIELRSGDLVKQGEVLARLVPLQAPLLDARSRSQTEAKVAAAIAATQQVKAQIGRANAALEYAKTEAARYEKLFKQNAVTRMELDRAQLDQRAREAELTSAEFGAKVAAHELQMARAALGRYDQKEGSKKENTESLTIPSPISGRVLKVIQQSEGVIQAGAPLVELGDPKALELVVDVLTSDAVHIAPGSPATIEDWGGSPLQAVVRTIEPSAFTRLSALGVEEQRVNTVLDLTAPYEEWAKLGDGYRVEARIEIFRAANVLTIPLSAMFRNSGNWAVFVDSHGAAQLRAIQVGRRNDRVAEVTSGLHDGDVVIVHPSDNVVEGVQLEAL